MERKSALHAGASSRGRVLAAVLVTAALFLSCFNDPLEPVAPSWDVNLTLPLFNRPYTLLELVEKEPDLLQVGEGNQIFYTTSLRVNPTVVGDAVALTPPDTIVHVKFGVFRVIAPPLTVPIDIPWLPRGSSVPVPDTTVTFPDIRDTIETFQSVTFDSGVVRLSITNNLPVPLEMLLPVEIRDVNDNTVAAFVFNPPVIPPNSSQSASDLLTGRTLTGTYRITGLSVHTPGSATPVPIPNGDLLVAALSTTGLRAREAILAHIPPQQLVDNDVASIVLDDSTIVREVRIHRGRLDLAFVNNVNLDMLFRFRFREMFRPNGGGFVPYQDSVFLRARGSGNVSLVLDGFRIQSPTFDLIRSLEVVSSVILPTGSSGPVTVHDTDKVLITVDTAQALTIDTALVVLKPTWVNVNTVVGVNFGDLPTRFSGELVIPAASLRLNTMADFGFPTDLRLRIGARRASGDSVFLPVPPVRIRPGIDSVIFIPGDVGAFLSQFTSRLPDSLRIEGRALINPPDVYDPSPAGVGGVGRNSSIGGSANLVAPLRLGIRDGIYRDTVALGDTTAGGYQNYQIDKDRIDDVNFGRVFIQVENGLPLEVGVDMRLLDRNGQSVLLLPQSGGRVTVSAAPVDANGNVTAPAHSTSIIELNEQEVRQFRPAEFLTYSLALRTTGGQIVRFRSNDYVKLRFWTSLSYRVNR